LKGRHFQGRCGSLDASLSLSHWNDLLSSSWLKFDGSSSMSYLGASLSSRERVTVGSAVSREHIHCCHRICASDSSNSVILSRISTWIGVTWSTQTWHSSFICSMTSCTWRASALLQCSVVTSVLLHGAGCCSDLTTWSCCAFAATCKWCDPVCCRVVWWHGYLMVLSHVWEIFSKSSFVFFLYSKLSSKLSGFWECSTCCVRRAPYNGHVSLVRLLWLWASAYIYLHQYIEICM